MSRLSFNMLNENKLRRWLALFFLALAVPAAALIYQAYDQLKWEAFHQHRLLAEELANRIDSRYAQLIAQEEGRAFVDYNFLVVVGDPRSNFIQRSPLSEFPVQSSIPGLIGYFQVDADGGFKTPLLPEGDIAASDYGIQPEELAQRTTLANRLQSILSDNRLVRIDKKDLDSGKRLRQTAAPAAATRADGAVSLFSRSRVSSDDAAGAESEVAEEIASGQAAFDRLAEMEAREQKSKKSARSTLGRVEDLQLDYRYQAAPAPQQQIAAPEKARKLEKRASRKERSTLPEPTAEADEALPASVAAPEEAGPGRIRIRTFESELDPFELSLLDSGHLVLYRKVWRDGQRTIQGALVEQSEFLTGVAENGFRETALSQMSELVIAHQGDVLSAYSAHSSYRYPTGSGELRGALLHQARLSAPLSDLELIFSINHLPAGPGGAIVAWIAAILFVVLCGGFYWMYRLGIGQIQLANQQQDFVSAVSHELKTPLTSIRMYGEMLREGWAPEEKKREYYDFIHDESERLSRLINNVLQLARMTRNDLQVNIESVTAGELMDTVRSKIASHVDRTGFSLNLDCPADCEQTTLAVDQDYFTQIIINLVDNALKFSAKAEDRTIDITCRRQQDNHMVFKVRDYGPGIPKDQMKKIFKLFYRSENELTRETVGTGIGLALVNQLATAMKGKVDAVNVEPGVEFRVFFPVSVKD